MLVLLCAAAHSTASTDVLAVRWLLDAASWNRAVASVWVPASFDAVIGSPGRKQVSGGHDRERCRLNCALAMTSLWALRGVPLARGDHDSRENWSRAVSVLATEIRRRGSAALGEDRGLCVRFFSMGGVGGGPWGSGVPAIGCTKTPHWCMPLQRLTPSHMPAAQHPCFRISFSCFRPLQNPQPPPASLPFFSIQPFPQFPTTSAPLP